MIQKSESLFEEDDFVVYPTHGVGRILEPKNAKLLV